MGASVSGLLLAVHIIHGVRLTRSNSIEAQLAQGIDVIADRYAFSGIAFSAGKVSRGGSEQREWRADRHRV